ncbi:hypothetical protein C8Q74DRAFT_1202280 [Fomes fomentarius]|nr:hypothetical protein C8Q74DRAFT_1202280 [Fomes fomentarius]
MASVLQQSEPHAFVEEELVRALNEQSFGLSSYEIVSTSPLKAIARVVLLEEAIIMVSLTSRGYQLNSPSEPPSDSDLDAEAVFENIEQLLQSVSPSYEAARRSVFVAKLSALSPSPS